MRGHWRAYAWNTTPVPLAMWWGIGQLPHLGGLSGGAHAVLGSAVDDRRSDAGAGRVGANEACRPAAPFRRKAALEELLADTESQVTVGVEVTNEGSDQGQMEPMLEQIAERYEQVPDEYLVDGGFASHDGIEQASERGATVYAPVPKPKDATRDPHTRLPTDGSAMGDWRERRQEPTKPRPSTRTGPQRWNA